MAMLARQSKRSTKAGDGGVRLARFRRATVAAAARRLWLAGGCAGRALDVIRRHFVYAAGGDGRAGRRFDEKAADIYR